MERESVELPEDLDELGLETLYERAKQVSDGGHPSSTLRSAGGSGRSTSDVVRRFALREADGVCQGCNSEVPFETESGEPYLEVHHITKVSDGGPDRPDNVIALCPNCHSEAHNGKNKNQLNEKLREKARSRTVSAPNQ